MNEETVKYFGEKVEALRAYILEECRRQGFTIREFEQFWKALEIDLDARQHKVYDELF